jgi:hypothetical protein
MEDNNKPIVEVKAKRIRRDWLALKEEFITGDEPAMSMFFKKKILI